MSSRLHLDEFAAVDFLEKGGRWQRQQILLGFIGYFSLCFQTLVIVFTGFQPKFTCKDDIVNLNGTQEIVFDNKCDASNTTANKSADCFEGYAYDVGRHESIVSDWDLICEKAYLAETSQLVYTVGMAVGSAVAPPLSDRLGRRRTYLGFRLLYVICCFGTSLAPNIFLFMVGRFLIGTIGFGGTLVVFVYLMEWSPARFRPIASVLTCALWALALCVETLLTYLLVGQSWRVTQVVVSIISLTVILDVLFLKESVVWLLANNRMGEASDILVSAMKKNKEAVRDFMDQKQSFAEENKDSLSHVGNPETIEMVETEKSIAVPLSEEENLHSNERRVTILEILKNKTTRTIALIVCYCWIVNSLVYFGIFYMSDALAGDRFLNFFLNGVVEIPSAIVLFVCLKYFGRRKPLVGLHVLCAVSLLLGGLLMVTLEDRIKYITMQIVGTVGKFGISATFSLIYIYTSEIFPTNVRTYGVGLCSAAGRIGALMAPFSNVLARELPWGPGLIFGGVCLIAALLLLKVPDTSDVTLPQSIAEVEVLKKMIKDSTASQE